jgi:hypothetical protein
MHFWCLCVVHLLFQHPTLYYHTLQLESCFDIVVLEGEMYQLSHLLTDQKTIMTSMMELSVTGNKGMYRFSENILLKLIT